MSDEHCIPAPGKTEIDQFLLREEFRRQSNKALHEHPSPLYWKPLSSPASLLLEERAEYSRNTKIDVNLSINARGWIRFDDKVIQFVGAGQCYIPMFQSLLASKRLEQIRGDGVEKSGGLKGIPIIVA